LHPASATTQCPIGNTDAHSQLKQKKKYEIEQVLLGREESQKENCWKRGALIFKNKGT
jgi:hypothetical protein